jgi:nickel-dependent lactate racemase
MRAGGWESLLPGARVRTIAPGLRVDPPRDPDGEVARPIAAAGIGEFLATAARQGEPVTLVVNDPHRATGSRRAIEVIVGLADAAGIRPRWRLLVATGSHAFAPGERRRHEEHLLGRRAGRFPERAWHDARDDRRLAAVGGRRLHRWVAEGRFAVGVGSLEPHYFAGVTGAHKTLTIGVMSLEDLRRNHAGALEAGSAPLALEGNPVFEGVVRTLESLEKAGMRLFAVDLIEAGGRLFGCTAGPPLQALRSGLPLVRRLFARRLEAPADLIVARVRPPLDRSFYQADKGIKNVERAVRDGGVILLDAPCPAGVGIDRFLSLLRRAATHAAAVRQVERQGYALGDHKAVRLRALTEGRGVRLGIIAPTLPPPAARLLHASRLASRSAAARWARRALGTPASRRPIRAVIVEDAGNLTLQAGPRSGPPRAARLRGG